MTSNARKEGHTPPQELSYVSTCLQSQVRMREQLEQRHGVGIVILTMIVITKQLPVRLNKHEMP